MGAQHLRWDADDYRQLVPLPDQPVIEDWWRSVLPFRGILRGDLVDEGRIAFDTVQLFSADLSIGVYWPEPCRNLTIELLTTRVYVTDPPPEQLLRFLTGAYGEPSAP